MKKLRPYKGVIYQNGFWYDPDGDRFSRATCLIESNKIRFTDDDHAELMRLKAEANEKAPTLEDVLLDWLSANNLHAEAYLGHLPNLCKRLRTAFPHIDNT